jgi:hypothetical protein
MPLRIASSKLLDDDAVISDVFATLISISSLVLHDVISLFAAYLIVKYAGHPNLGPGSAREPARAANPALGQPPANCPQVAHLGFADDRILPSR